MSKGNREILSIACCLFSGYCTLTSYGFLLAYAAGDWGMRFMARNFSATFAFGGFLAATALVLAWNLNGRWHSRLTRLLALIVLTVWIELAVSLALASTLSRVVYRSPNYLRFVVNKVTAAEQLCNQRDAPCLTSRTLRSRVGYLRRNFPTSSRKRATSSKRSSGVRSRP